MNTRLLGEHHHTQPVVCLTVLPPQTREEEAGEQRWRGSTGTTSVRQSELNQESPCLLFSSKLQQQQKHSTGSRAVSHAQALPTACSAVASAGSC